MNLVLQVNGIVKWAIDPIWMNKWIKDLFPINLRGTKLKKSFFIFISGF